MKHRDHEALGALHNAYAGERVFIVGTGPSLKYVDMRRLNDEYLFGVGGLVAYGGLTKPLDFYGLRETTSLGAICPAIGAKMPACVQFYANTMDLTMWPQHRDYMANWIWLYTHPNRFVESGDIAGFEDDLDWVGQAFSPVFGCALPVCVWMGFKQIYLLGCDNRPNGFAYTSSDEDSLPGLRIPATFTQDELEIHRQAVGRAAARASVVLAEHDVALVDLTEGGSLHMARATLDEVLA